MDFSFLFIILCSFIHFNLSKREEDCGYSNFIKCKRGVPNGPERGGDYDVRNFITSPENNRYKIGLLSFKESKENEGAGKDSERGTKKIKNRRNKRRHQRGEKSTKKKAGKLNKETKTLLNSNLKLDQIETPPTFHEFKINLGKEIRENKIYQENEIENEIKASSLFRENNFINFKNSFNLKQTLDDINKGYYVPVNYGNQPDNEVNPVHNQTAIKEFQHTFLKNGKLKNRPPVDVKNAVVRTHNILRGKVHPPAQNMLAMSWSSAAAEQAQKWADNCYPGAETDHPSQRWTRTFGTCGQNVFVAFKKKRWSSVLRSWWNERRNFHYNYSENNITLVGKYTQMAWYNSHKVGCASAQCANPNGKKFYRYVCNYCPTGNDPRKIHRPYSEGEQCGSCPNSCISVCRTKQCKLCTNNCPLSDLWNNCPSLYEHWKNWLCNTKTADGVMRFKNCRATCQCQNKIT